MRMTHQGPKTLFLQAPSFEGFDGAARSRYREMPVSPQTMRRRLREGVECFRFLRAREA